MTKMERLINDNLTWVQIEQMMVVDNMPHMFEKIAPKDQFKELALLAIEKSHANFKKVNPHLIDDSFIDEALETDGLLLMYLSSEQITYERCLKAVKTGVSGILRFIPEKFITDELLLKVSENQSLLTHK